ncbi:MAG: diaminopimelate epimerase [Chloroflexi bacterium]|nr:diaminopimelate epimerase [Chloroflexota bacterium]
MKFTKVQGAGNDFVLFEPGESRRNWSRLAMAMCNRHFGVGADGLLLVLPSKKADFRMRIFNPDGSEAEACGNGLRCSAKYVLDRGLAGTRGSEITAETLCGIRKVRFLRRGKQLTKLQIGMGQPAFGADEVPVAVKSGRKSLEPGQPILNYPVDVDGEKFMLSFVSMGNPHAVLFWKKPVSVFPLSHIGSLVENHPIFPKRTNFEVVNIIDRRQVVARVWERGAGETLACGSGACAVAAVAQLLGYVDNKVDIKLPGGTLVAEWDGKGEVFLSGPAEEVFTGEWPESSR